MGKKRSKRTPEQQGFRDGAGGKFTYHKDIARDKNYRKGYRRGIAVKRSGVNRKKHR